VVEQMIGADAIASPAMVAELKRFFGLDQPWYLQYGRWLGRLVQGDFGTSWRTGKPVVALILERLPVTLELTAFAMAFALALGGVAGIVSAVRRDQAVDNVTRVGTLLGLSVPVFWQGTMLILFFSLYLRWMPPVVWVDLWTDPGRNLTIMVLPALCLGTASAANIARTTRACMLDVLGSEYIRTAAAKGLAARIVVLKHALRNALIPVVTVVGLQIGILLGGTTCIPREDGDTMRALYTGNAATDPDGWTLISWNEFAEGTYVDPMQRYGHDYLDVLRQILSSRSSSPSP